MLVLTISDLAGLFTAGWLAGILTAVGMAIWAVRKDRKED